MIHDILTARFKRAVFIMKRGRYLGILLILLLVGSGILAVPRPAKADPHAMFYTAIGQRQLFFNFLAALDQADYVEPATGQFSREELADKRTEAGLPPEDNGVLTATKTDLASVITRGVTLEGQDLWTAYQRFQLALEASRRNSTNELARKFCEHALGIIGCDPSKLDNRQQDRAIEQDLIAESATAVFERGTQAAFASGSTNGIYGDDQATRDKIDKGKSQPTQFYAYDPSIALLRELAGKDTSKQQFIDTIFGVAENSFLPTALDPHVLDDIQYDSTGRAGLAFALPGRAGTGTAYAASSIVEGDEYVEKYLNTMMGLLELPVAISAIGQQAADRAMISRSADKDGFKAQRKYETQTIDTDGDGKADTIGELKANVISPSEARKADLQALEQLAATTAASQVYAPAQAVDVPGDTQFLERGSATATDPGAPRRTLGISTSTPASQAELEASLKQIDSLKKKIESGEVKEGEVEGITSYIIGLIYRLYDEQKKPFNTNPNPIAPFNEEGMRAALTAANPYFDPKEAEKISSGGYGDFMDNIWALFCSILPLPMICF